MNIEWIVSSCVLILLVILVRAVFRKRISLRVRYCLWAVVALRLLLPVSFSGTYISVLNLLPERNNTEAGAVRSNGGVGIGQQPEDEGGQAQVFPTGDVRKDAYLPGEEGQSGVAGEENIPLGTGKEQDSPAGDARKAASLPGENQSGAAGRENIQTESGQEQGSPEESIQESRETSLREKTPSEKTGLIRVLYCVWLFGAGLFGIELLAVNLDHSRRLKRGRKRIAPELLPWEGRLPVYQAEPVRTPCLFGLIHPAVYVTEEVTAEERAFAYVLCHENCHYSHRDNWWVLVRALCCCLHWYNPLVWLAAYLSRQDGELACDERALELLGGGQRIDYGRVLLKLCAKRPFGISGLQLSTSMSGGKRQLKERLQMIVEGPKKAAGALAVLFVLAAVILTATFTGRREGQEAEPPAEGTEDRGTVPDRDTAEALGESGTFLSENDEKSDEPADGSGEEEAWIFGYNNYTGYLDQCIQWTDYQGFADLDLDGDGLTDRVWRENVEDWALADYRIDFGNGDVAELYGMGGGIPRVRTLDINGDGAAELLFTLSYDFSTDPRAFGENALLMRGEGGAYEPVMLPEDMEAVNIGETGQGVRKDYLWSFSAMCEPAGGTSLRLTGLTLSSAVKLDIVKTFTEEEWESGCSTFDTWMRLEAPAYQVDIVKDDTEEKDILVLHYSLWGKQSSDEVLVTLEYEDDRNRMRMCNLEYLEYYRESRTTTIGEKEYELTVASHGIAGEGLYDIDFIWLTDPENPQLSAASVRPEEVSRTYWNTPEGEEPFPVRSIMKDGGVFMTDLNFDGYEDLCFQGWVTAGANIPYYCMLWNPDSQSFEYSAVLCNVEADAEEQWISSWERVGGGQYVTAYYRYDEANRLHLVRYVEENLSPEAVFEKLDLTYASSGSIYTLPALLQAETDSYEGETCGKLLSMAKLALEELYQWTGEKVDTVCFQVTNMGTVSFALSPEDMEHSRIFFSRSFGADTEYNLSNYERNISDISVASAEEVSYSPVSWRVQPEKRAAMSDEDIVSWYFQRSPTADAAAVSVERRYEDTWIIQTESGSWYEAVYNAETGQVSALTGPYPVYPEH